MIYSIAIDDEPLALDLLRNFASRNKNIELVGCFSSVEEAVNALNTIHVDLLFLDIEMPDINGLDFYRKYASNKMVIFTTAYQDYAIEGFDVNAIDFLLKPIKYDRFHEACERAKVYQEARKTANSKFSRNLMVRSEYAMIKVPLEQITFIETMDDYIKIHLLEDSPILTLSSMTKMLKRLPADEFVRVHRSYIVSIDQVKTYRSNSVGLENITLPVGRSYQKEVRQLFEHLG